MGLTSEEYLLIGPADAIAISRPSTTVVWVSCILSEIFNDSGGEMKGGISINGRENEDNRELPAADYARDG